MIEGLINPKLRYGDYYNERLRYLECLEYGKICGVEIEGFMLYCLNKMIENTSLLFFGDEICSSLEEALGLIDFDRDLLDFEDCVNDLCVLVEKKIMEDEERKNAQLPFLDDGLPFKIFFAGHSSDDINKLPKQVVLQLINKLRDPLASQLYIQLSEGIDHIREKYGIPISRIHVANDYRIAYIRLENITIILGVAMKTGKDMDYGRYESVARNIDVIYKNAKDYVDGILIEESEHFRIIEKLQSIYLEKQGTKGKGV